MEYEKHGYSITEFARAIGVGSNKIYRLLNSGKLPNVKIGARRIIPLQPEEFLLNLPVNGGKDD